MLKNINAGKPLYLQQSYTNSEKKCDLLSNIATN